MNTWKIIVTKYESSLKILMKKNVLMIAVDAVMTKSSLQVKSSVLKNSNLWRKRVARTHQMKDISFQLALHAKYAIGPS